MKEKKGERLQTVERALEVLYLFREHNGSTLSFVAENLGMSTTVAYRLLYTLTACGFLRQEPEGKKYYLGEKVMILGYKAIESQELKEVARPIIRELKEQIDFGVILTICVENSSLCLEKVEDNENLQLAMRVGGLYPLYKGASNRPLLAFMEEEKRNRCLDSYQMEENDREELKGQLAQIRSRGYDYSSGLLTRGLFAIGFPVYGMGNCLVAALSVGGYSSELDEKDLECYLEKTRLASQSLSRLLGAKNLF